MTHHWRLTRPDWDAALPRLRALQLLRLKSLPTAWLVRWNYIGAGIFGAFAALSMNWGVAWLAALCVVVALLEFLNGRELARSIKTGNIGAGRLGRFFGHRATETVGSAGKG